jgi:hypothetical protein
LGATKIALRFPRAKRFGQDRGVGGEGKIYEGATYARVKYSWRRHTVIPNSETKLTGDLYHSNLVNLWLFVTDRHSTLDITDRLTRFVYSLLSFLLDLLTSGWVVLVFAILFGLLPSIAFPQTALSSLSSRIVGAFVRTVATIAIGSILWVKLGLFSWLTAVLVYVGGLSIGWLASNQWKYQLKFQQLGQNIAIATIDIFDRGLSLHQVFSWLLVGGKSIAASIRTQFDRRRWNLPVVLLTMICATAILGFTIWLRFSLPLTEFRFSHRDTYNYLLITQQILARHLPQINYLPLFASVAAFLSALSGVHPVRVVHLLGAIFGTLLVLSIGYAIGRLTKNESATLVATYSLGAYLFVWTLPISIHLPIVMQRWLGILRDNLGEGLVRSWAVSDLEVGAIFVVLALGCSTHLVRASERTEALINICCCILLVAIVSPSLLLLVLLGGFGTIFGRQMALFTVSTSWVILALVAALPNSELPSLSGILATLPIGLSLYMGMLSVATASAFRSLLGNWSAPVCLTVFLAISVNFCLPPPAQITYLEYDLAARKVLEIDRTFLPHQWTIVAPIEQFPQVYGRGWYQDAAQFTDKYHDFVGEPNFQLPITTPLFVFVEKQPFAADKPAKAVLYSVSIDPTYRHYRSPSGRTKLSQAMLQLCETYRHQHPDSRIYYEDANLRIYQFSPRRS